MEDVQGNQQKYISWIYNILTIKKNLLLNLLYMPIASQSEELSYVRTVYTIYLHMGGNLFMSIEYSSNKLSLIDWLFREAAKKVLLLMCNGRAMKRGGGGKGPGH